MVYSREVDGEELTFEASGGLRDSALVMRDRETDSWWSIMTSDAIGGELQGAGLEELPLGEKVPWGEWRQRHPHTKVLSINGREHEGFDPYEDYFASEWTFDGTGVDDRRLPAKEPIFAFRYRGRSHAVANAVAEDGVLLELAPESESVLMVYRPADAPLKASSQAWLVPRTLVGGDIQQLRQQAAEGADGTSRVIGFDTFWYTWVAANPDTILLDEAARIPSG